MVLHALWGVSVLRRARPVRPPVSNSRCFPGLLRLVAVVSIRRGAWPPFLDSTTTTSWIHTSSAFSSAATNLDHRHRLLYPDPAISPRHSRYRNSNSLLLANIGVAAAENTATTAPPTDFPSYSSSSAAAVRAAGGGEGSSRPSSSSLSLSSSSPHPSAPTPTGISSPIRRSSSGRFYSSRLSPPSSDAIPPFSHAATINPFSPSPSPSPSPSSSSALPRRSRQSSLPSARPTPTSRLSLTLPTRASFSTSSSHSATTSITESRPHLQQHLGDPPPFPSIPASATSVAPTPAPTSVLAPASSSPVLAPKTAPPPPMASVPSGTTSNSSVIHTPRSSSPSSISTKRSSLSSHRMADSNPVASVDVSAIEEAMKVASLDQLRGYAQNNYGEVHQTGTTEYLSQSQAAGFQVLREPLWNKGLSFTPEERISKRLTGLVPHVMESLETQCARAMKMINSRKTNIDKYLYLSNLKDQNIDLFYRVLIDNVRDLMPLVYTPTIGDVCLQYSTLYTRPEALYISIKQRKSIRTMLRNWPHAKPEICVVTDGSRILGLGDLGINGVGISIGKLALYTAAAGIHPEKTLPIVLDCGTNNEDNLKDPFYLGLRAKRVPMNVQQEFMDEFMEAAADVYPDMVVQFEDFESEKAFNYLARYRRKSKCFNDDIQGTGAVVLGGYIGAVNLSNVPLEEQRLVFMGAGSAGVGVAKQLVEYYTRRGLTEQEAKDKFWLVDTKGLVTKDRGDRLAEHKKYFARTDNNGHQFRTLEEVIEYVRPSALVGLTATHGVFTESVVRALKASVDAGGLNRRPILFPLSNPLTKAECTFEQAVQWTDGTVLFASGSPFSPFTTRIAGAETVTYHPNQGNNVYIFPGLGLGAILAKASRVTDEMVYVSAAALAGALNADEIHKGLIYPRIERVREASVVVAREVMKAARREGVSELPEEQWTEWEEWGDVALTAYIKQRTYDPMCFSDVKGHHRL